ncbi:TapY2 family type IVa secretion system protein [Shewanella algae]|uniref:TapY2 family type IVa secretion system protein n=1 Tax=Shewanella algae TaxID=38313 RepID=UPI001AAD6ED0|nr:TapY2 family type IVa secretion system protein [Shewanella algae]MBO2676037.1 TapY2 family type IVa secretion system protein [Shewanella algae]
MMKSIKYGLLLILPGIVLTTQAAERQEVKCHLITSKGEQIAFYRWDLEKQPLLMARLSSKPLKDTQGKRYYIKQASECVLLNEVFSSDKARKLDEVTLR